MGVRHDGGVRSAHQDRRRRGAVHGPGGGTGRDRPIQPAVSGLFVRAAAERDDAGAPHRVLARSRLRGRAVRRRRRGRGCGAGLRAPGTSRGPRRRRTAGARTCLGPAGRVPPRRPAARGSRGSRRPCRKRTPLLPHRRDDDPGAVGDSPPCGRTQRLVRRAVRLGFDLLVTPTVPFDPTRRRGRIPSRSRDARCRGPTSSFTIPFNLSWHPAATVRVGPPAPGCPWARRSPLRATATTRAQAAFAFEREVHGAAPHVVTRLAGGRRVQSHGREIPGHAGRRRMTDNELRRRSRR